MDHAQARALAALQPFVHLAVTTRSPSPRFLADLINRATSAQGTYIFTELLQTPAIQLLRSADTPAESQASLTLLEIYSYGTYKDYKSTPNLPDLSDQQTSKLRQLSLLSLAASATPLTYANLLLELSLPTPQSLETLITSSIYASLITARLSPTSNPPVVNITSVAPLRDLRPHSLPELLQILNVWESRCTGVISSLESQINTIRTDAGARTALAKKRQDIVDMAVLTKGDAQLESDGPKTAGGMSMRGRKGPKRDLEEQQEDDGYWDAEAGSGDDGGMDVDDAGGTTIAPARGGGAGRSTKKRGGRGRP